MPPKQPVVEDEFDDDTDFALPVAPPAASGSGGMPSFPGMPQMTPEQMQQFQQMMMGGGAGGMGAAGPSGGAPMTSHAATDPRASAEAKKWITLYPIYFDAKRSNKVGERRVSWKHASLYPLSSGLVKAAGKLGLRFVHEPYKTHPRDWENPGRVKVQLFDEEGKATHGSIRNRKQLVVAVAPLLQQACGGPPPVDLPKREKAGKPAADAKAVTHKTDGKTAKGAATVGSAGAKPTKKRRSAGTSSQSSRISRNKLLKPHLPPPQVRLPHTSPALPAGLLNMDLASAMGGGDGGAAGGLPGGAGGNPMGALGSMMGNLGFGNENDEQDAAADGGPSEADKRRQNDPMRGMGRRGRKRVVRMGR
ncbi:unnamed protein product [Parajaminaea phylloscopi]